jgi:hypothetical protein
LNRQIAHIVDAIKSSGRFSEAINQALADLETQRDSIRNALAEAEKRANQRMGAETLAERIMAYFGEFDRIWNQGLTVDERKDLLRCYVHQVNVSHSPTNVEAEIWLYKVPIPQTQMTPVLNGIEPLITRVNCGGRNLTLVKQMTEKLLPFVTRRFITLKRPYAHYRPKAA